MLYAKTWEHLSVVATLSIVILQYNIFKFCHEEENVSFVFPQDLCGVTTTINMQCYGAVGVHVKQMQCQIVSVVKVFPADWMSSV
jgi:hypothetical protein